MKMENLHITATSEIVCVHWHDNIFVTLDVLCLCFDFLPQFIRVFFTDIQVNQVLAL